MLSHVPVVDIRITDDFGYDFGDAPDRVQRRVNDLIEKVLEVGHFLPSMNVHTTFMADMCIAYVTKNREHWRILFWYDEDNDTAIFHRLLTHVEMDKYLVNVPV